MTVKDLKRGDFFTKKRIEYPTDLQVWVRGDYDRSMKRYECWRFGDINDVWYLHGDREIYTDFIF